MKKLNFKNLMHTFIITAAIILYVSCNYQTIADADYPSQRIYMPSASNNFYIVNDTNATTGIFRYKLDLANNKLIIPLGVYRSGVNNTGSVSVKVTVNNDTINKIITSGAAIDSKGNNIELLSESAYTIPTTVSIVNGEELAKIDLTIDLDYIANKPNKRITLGITISSSQVNVDLSRCTTLLELNTNFIVPTAKFDYIADKKNDKKFTFTNLSSYATSCTWDFGDGTIVVSNNDTLQHVFSDYTIYNVKLTITGITGKPVVYFIPLQIWKNISSTYIQNPGNPFLRSDVSRSQLIGNLSNWTTTDNLKTLSSGILYGGFLRNYTLSNVVYNGLMDFYSKSALVNAKIYQTITLPSGSYRITFTLLDFTGRNDCYFAVASGSAMPDAGQIEESNVICKQFFNMALSGEQELFFTLPTEQTITLGFVVNTQTPVKGVFNEVFIKSIGLFK